jgi:hypothetical protein
MLGHKLTVRLLEGVGAPGDVTVSLFVGADLRVVASVDVVAELVLGL